jgi:folate-binding protein YgfZ
MTHPSPLLSTPGAVPGDGRDAAVAAHYGDPMREQRLLVEGLAAVDLGHRGVITVSGRDRLSWLHSLTTQQLTGLAPRTSAQSLILSPKGHVEHDLHVVDDGEQTWITVEPGTHEAVVSWLDSMRFMLDVAVTDRTGEHVVIGEAGSRESVDGEPLAWVDPWPGPVGDTFEYGPPTAEHPGRTWRTREVIVPAADVVAAVGDRQLAGLWAWEALRVAAWRPRLGAETDHRTIPHEVDWLRSAVHLQKGCYRGQETVARVKNLGRPPRRLVALHLDGSGHVIPQAGEPVRLGDKAVGHLTSVARHHEDGPIALALVKRSTDPEATLTAGEGVGVAAAQTVIVAP